MTKMFLPGVRGAVLTILALVLPGALFAQPNDNCDAHKVINSPGTQNETNTGQSEYWYSFQTPDDGNSHDLTVTAAGTTISIFNFPCVANDLITSSAPGLGEVTATALLANAAYLIKITDGNPGVPFDLEPFDVTSAIAAGGGDGGSGGGTDNNTCENAVIIITEGTQTTGTGLSSYWYQITMPSTASTLELSSDPGADIPVTVYTGPDCSNLTQAAQGSSANGLSITTLAPDAVVWIEWGAAMGNVQSFVLNLLPSGGGGGGGTTPSTIILSSTTIDEGVSPFSVVGDLSTDNGSGFTFSLVAGAGDADNSSFDIVPGAVPQLVMTETPDFETKPSYSVRIRADDGLVVIEEIIIITVNDQPDNGGGGGGGTPTQIILSATTIDENVPALSVVGELTTDVGSAFFFQLVNGAGDTDNALFEIETGAVAQLKIKESPDFETKTSYSVRILADNGIGDFVEDAITITVNDLQENGGGTPNPITLSSTTVNENILPGSVVADLRTDIGSGFVFSLVDGEGADDNNAFSVTQAPPQLLIEERPDFETKASYNIRIKVANFDYVAEKAFTIFVNDLDENGGGGLTAQTITFDQTFTNIVYGDVINLTATASSGLPVTYTVISGPASVSGNELTITGAGSISVQASQSGNSTYAAADNEERNFTASAKVVTASGIVASNKEYDGNTNANITDGTLSGVLGNDDVQLAPTASFNTSQAGTNKIISGFTLTGSAAAKYELTQPNGITANINQKPLTITGISVANKEYDGSTEASITGTPALSGVVGSDDLVLDGTVVAAFADKLPGTSKGVTVTGYTLAGTSALNYSFPANFSFTADILTKSLTVTGLSVEDKVYDRIRTATLTGTPVLSGVIAGDEVILSGIPGGVFEDANAGIDKPITIDGMSLTGAQADYYTLEPLVLTATIKKAPQTIIFPPVEAVAIGTQFQLNTRINSELRIQYSVSPAGAVGIETSAAIATGRIAGPVTVTASQPGDENHNAAADVQQSFCINPSYPTIAFNYLNDGTVELSVTDGADGIRWFRNGTFISTSPTVQITATDLENGGEFHATRTVLGCESSLSNVLLVSVTAIEESTRTLELWPNPATETLSVRGVAAGAIHRVMNSSGQVLGVPYQTENGNLLLNVSTLQAGLYQLQIRAGGKTQTLRFIRSN